MRHLHVKSSLRVNALSLSISHWPVGPISLISRLVRKNAHLSVKFPRCRNIYQKDIFPFPPLLPAVTIRIMGPWATVGPTFSLGRTTGQWELLNISIWKTHWTIQYLLITKNLWLVDLKWSSHIFNEFHDVCRKYFYFI